MIRSYGRQGRIGAHLHRRLNARPRSTRHGFWQLDGVASSMPAVHPPTCARMANDCSALPPFAEHDDGNAEAPRAAQALEAQNCPAMPIQGEHSFRRAESGNGERLDLAVGGLLEAGAPARTGEPPSRRAHHHEPGRLQSLEVGAGGVAALVSPNRPALRNARRRADPSAAHSHRHPVVERTLQCAARWPSVNDRARWRAMPLGAGRPVSTSSSAPAVRRGRPSQPTGVCEGNCHSDQRGGRRRPRPREDRPVGARHAAR